MNPRIPTSAEIAKQIGKTKRHLADLNAQYLTAWTREEEERLALQAAKAS